MKRYDPNIVELIERGRLIKTQGYTRHPDETYLTVTDRRGNAHVYRYVPEPQSRRTDAQK